MRRAVPALFLPLLPLLIVACSPRKDQETTRQVIANAYIARSAVSDLLTRYGEILNPAGNPPGSVTRGWEDVAKFRESAEGRAEEEFLVAYSKPVQVDPAFARSREIKDVSLVTAELVNRALEPRGTWESFVQEMQGIRSRLDRAVSGLEAGTKSFILIEARTETEEKAMAFSKALAVARAGSDPGKRETPGTP